jgi:hypothetical protein
MKSRASGLIVIASQLLIVGLFFVTIFNNDIKVRKYASVVHNENLDKIATSVSLLFEDEMVPVINYYDDFSLEDLPSIDVVVNEKKEEEINNDDVIVESSPLVSIDADKYIDNLSMGFEVTEGNKEYSLSDNEFNVVVAVVAGEFGNNLNDALGVVSVILNRCDSDTWVRWAGNNPYKQVIKKGQFEVYQKGYYLSYMPNGKNYGGTKYQMAKQAVIDGLNGIRNNNYLGFRSWYSTGYSDKYVVSGGNRYGFN